MGGNPQGQQTSQAPSFDLLGNDQNQNFGKNSSQEDERKKGVCAYF